MTHENCNKAFELIGDRWTLSIFYVLKKQDERFCALQRELNLNPITLTKRLKKLEEFKLIKRIEGTEDKKSVTYSLTPLGREFLPIVDSIEAFGIRLKQI
ncbi:MAG TPA: helix-turn-helix domain-containing protein [Patescibacteria group bacterium]